MTPTSSFLSQRPSDLVGALKEIALLNLLISTYRELLNEAVNLLEDRDEAQEFLEKAEEFL